MMRKVRLLCFILLSSLVCTVFSAKITQELTINVKKTDLNRAAVKKIIEAIDRASREEIQTWLKEGNGAVLSRYLERESALAKALDAAIHEGLSREEEVSSFASTRRGERFQSSESPRPEESERSLPPSTFGPRQRFRQSPVRIESGCECVGKTLEGLRMQLGHLREENEGLTRENEELKRRLDESRRSASEEMSGQVRDLESQVSTQRSELEASAEREKELRRAAAEIDVFRRELADREEALRRELVTAEERLRQAAEREAQLKAALEAAKGQQAEERHSPSPGPSVDPSASSGGDVPVRVGGMSDDDLIAAAKKLTSASSVEELTTFAGELHKRQAAASGPAKKKFSGVTKVDTLLHAKKS
jgi:chromosome segregation ATPase